MRVCEIVYLTLGIYELLSLINILYYLCNLNPYLLFIVVVVVIALFLVSVYVLCCLHIWLMFLLLLLLPCRQWRRS